jgi:hypothetical protein
MMSHGHLVSSLGQVIAVVADVKLEGDVWSGQCTLAPVLDFLRLFHSYEEAVNGQLFGLIDALDEQISGLSPRLVDASGQSVTIHDLQIFPSTGVGSWRVAR